MLRAGMECLLRAGLDGSAAPAAAPRQRLGRPELVRARPRRVVVVAGERTEAAHTAAGDRRPRTIDFLARVRREGGRHQIRNS